MLEIKNATKKYGSQIVLNDVSLSLAKGEVMAFLGPNGAGKSTLMKSILGLIALDKGEVCLDGKRINSGDVEHNAKIGYLPELNPLYTNMYVVEYLSFIAACYGMRGKEKKMAVEWVVEQTGLTSERKKTISHLSKGYKQRVGLAAAIIHKPELLILDEPMTGLDPNQQVEIRNLIKSLAEDRAIMISTHIMQEVEAMCHTIVILNKGDIVYSAPIAKVESEYGTVENAFRMFTTDKA